MRMGWWLGFFFSWNVLANAPPEIPLLDIRGPIDPGTSQYVSAGIDWAEKNGSPFLFLMLDTPGGLLSSTREIVQKMLNAKLPVVVFVGPRGAHAGSGGALIVLAADISAMAPGTQIGAVHPVAAGGTINPVMLEKITNDTAALAEGLAKNHRRNAEWAVSSVRESASLTSEDAVKLNVIDLLADDSAALLKKLNGWQLKSPKNGTQFLTAGSFSPHPLRPSFSQRFLSFFSDPSVAYLLLIFGGLCFWLELSHPGLIFPGVVGAFCLLTALISFQMLPIRVGALGLIFLGLGLLTAELFLPTFGLLGLAGIGSFIFGSLFLMEPSAADIALSLKIILPSAAVLSVAVLLLARAVWKGQKQRLRSGLGALVGELGETREAISADGGLILIHGELWRAVAPASENISVGTIVVVTEVKNMLLVVRPNLTKE